MEKKSSNGGVGFLGMLTILFIGLKLSDIIDWSWWAVVSPLWIPIAILASVSTLLVISFGLTAFCRRN